MRSSTVPRRARRFSTSSGLDSVHLGWDLMRLSPVCCIYFWTFELLILATLVQPISPIINLLLRFALHNSSTYEAPRYYSHSLRPASCGMRVCLNAARCVRRPPGVRADIRSEGAAPGASQARGWTFLNSGLLLFQIDKLLNIEKRG